MAILSHPWSTHSFDEDPTCPSWCIGHDLDAADPGVLCHQTASTCFPTSGNGSIEVAASIYIDPEQTRVDREVHIGGHALSLRVARVLAVAVLAAVDQASH